MKINSILPQDNKFTTVLTTIAKPPQALYYLGTLPNSRQPTAAIVGTRKPTSYGREVASVIAFELAKRGVVIVSGLALGTDAIAHRSALEAGGTTIAVQANGLHKIYPHTNRALGQKIIQSGGALVSEYSKGTEPRPYQFLERNRIVSGLSDVVIVVEAAKRSGTLSTATHALDQGRDVFAVPGNITNPLSEGCNRLIQQGATPLLSAEDVLETLGMNATEAAPQAKLALASTPLEAKIIELLQSGVRDGSELQVKTQASASEFNTTLTMMEINGIVRALGANQWSL